jgi:hypothetical protein
VITIQPFIAGNDLLKLRYIPIPLISIIWLYLGLLISKKLKANEAFKEKDQYTDKGVTFAAEVLFSTVLFVLFFLLVFIRSKYADYLAVPYLFFYGRWFYAKMKFLNRYFKEE